MNLKKTGVIVASLVAASLALTGCAGSSSSDETVKIGVVGASDPYWETFTEAAEAEGITVELIDFTDYNQPNPALSEGELDLNQFQHIQYLADYNVANDDDLVPIGATAIYPLGIFSTKHAELSEIPEGGTVAVPSDPSNRARALNVLQAAELIELTDGGTLFSTPAEIDEAASKVKVTEMDASFTATSLSDVDAAVVNNDFVTDAGLKFEEALYQDDPADEGAKYFINIFAATSAEKDNATFKKLVEIYQSNEDVQAGVLENSGDSAILLDTPVGDLEQILKDAEDQIKSNG